MSVGGAGIPRLQDLSYFEAALTALVGGATFEQVRRAILERAGEIEREADFDGSFDERKWDRMRIDGTKYVHPTVDVLKELMRLGWLERALLPSGPSSAYLHRDTTYTVTAQGKHWADRIRADRRDGYNALLGHLVAAHPHLEGFLRVVGARPDSTSAHLTVPLLRWDVTVHDSESSYMNAFVENVCSSVRDGSISWSEAPEEIDAHIRGYVGRITARLAAREKPHSRREFVSWCEEAATKLAFASAGTPLDYISMELLRRWTRFLGVANFSYYAAEPYALRLWATGTVSGSGDDVRIVRRVGPDVRRRALDALLQTWLGRPAAPSAGMYAPIWELRAAVCWQERISDDEFDKALAEALAGEHEGLRFRVHLDQASVRATPPSTRPLVLTMANGLKRVFNLATIIPIGKEQR